MEPENPHEWTGSDLFSDPSERQHLYSILDSFQQYRALSHRNITHTRRQNFYALPTSQWTLLASPPFSYLDHLSHIDDAIDLNADISDSILSSGIESLGLTHLLPSPSNPKSKPPWNGTATKLNMDKARSTINQLYRDWSSEGASERDKCISPILTTLDTHHPHRASVSSKPKILVPGAGLGRLVFELSRAGYDVEGNEISYHQLLASSLILNVANEVGQWSVHPWISSFSNNLCKDDQLRAYKVPDVVPSQTHVEGGMSMTTGDFVELYSEEDAAGTFDAVASVFFIDTSPNFLNYVNTVWNCLKDGGLWINIGPLLWHFNSDERKREDDDENEEGDEDAREYRSRGSFELSDEDVVALVRQSGFEVVTHEPGSIETGYIQNPDSMLRNTYRASFWVARKIVRS